jgi:hypothetical protein
MNINKDEPDTSVKFKLGSSIPFGTLITIIIQTIIIIATTVGVFSTYMGKIDKLADDQEIIRKELQIMRTEVITRNEASVQFTFINDQLRRQDGEIRDLQSQVYTK